MARDQLLKFLLTALTLSLPIPAGIVLPVMCMGAGFARLFGEFSGYGVCCFAMVPT